MTNNPISINSIRSALRTAVEVNAIRAALPQEMSAEDRVLYPFSAWMIDNVPQYTCKLYHCWPGAGKSETIRRVAEEYAETSPTLVLGLSHKAFENVSMGDLWEHWKGHDSVSRGDPATCKVNLLRGKGYNANWDSCTCLEPRTLATDKPTFAPVEYVLSDTEGGPPLRPESHRYRQWVFDEVDFAKFVGRMILTRQDIQVTAEKHPDDSVRWLARSLLTVMSQHTAANTGKKRYDDSVHWSGSEFYRRLDEALTDEASTQINEGPFLAYLRASFEALHQTNASDEWVHAKIASWPKDTEWISGNDVRWLPGNLAPIVIPRLWSEGIAHQQDLPFQPNIHIAWDRPEEGQPIQSLLRFSWKKSVAGAAPPISILDASADALLLEQVFGAIDTTFELPERLLPDSINVYQLLTKRVTRGTLDLGPGGGPQKLPKKYRKSLQDELTVRGTSNPDGTPRKLGIISFKDVLDDCVAAADEVGFPRSSIETGWYYNLRGDNDFENCDLLVVLGFPAPNPHALYEEACALFRDDPNPISTEIMRFDDVLQLRDGGTANVDGLFGYADDRLHRLYLQKSRWELYQAFHRSRPLISGESEDQKDVLVFTNVPVPGVEIKGFLDKEGKVMDTLNRQLGESAISQGNYQQITNKDLVDVVLDDHPALWTTKDALNRWIRRESIWLASATRSEYVSGNGRGSPGLFRRSAT